MENNRRCLDGPGISVKPGKVNGNYGMAIDIGTTTIAGYLCDLNTMEVINTVSMMNPQCKYGEDVMARITYHMQNPDGLKRMSDDLVNGLNRLIDDGGLAVAPVLAGKELIPVAPGGVFRLQLAFR